ncbi:site-specific DNA recombinase [Microbacterium sp. ZKA21]|uniref:recombinase family protein n=1 Tax=Microbacterium sp. ZKA21 TaxID=3381694 RepID=UPI003D2404F1
MATDLDFLGPETCAVYLRISQDRTGQNLGVQRQKKDTVALAKQLGLRVTKIYTDNDISATSGKIRPQFEQMLRDRPETIIAWHQDRLLRLTSDLEKVIDLATPVHFVTAGTLDLATPAGRAVARTIAAWSQYEGEQKAVRQKAANVQRAERGHWQFSRRPFGYQRVDGEVLVIPEEAEIVREGYRRYIAGETYYAIAQDWNSRGIRTLGTGNGEGTTWSMARVTQLLRNPRYAGIVQSKGVIYDVEPQWEAIIDRRTWDDYLATREGRRKPHGWSRSVKHILSGVALCGVCGGTLTARPEYRNTPDGRVAEQAYACFDNWCVAVRADEIDPFVNGLIKARLQDKEIVRGLRQTPDTEPLEKEIGQLRRRRENITDLLADGILDRRRAREQATDLTRRIDSISARLSAMRRQSPLTDLALSKSVPAKWDKLPVLQQRRVMDDLGLQITVGRSARRGKRPRDAEGQVIPELDRFTVDWLPR